MRNPLKRRPSAEPKPSLRERLRATKAKAGRVLTVNRILLKPDPKPAPTVDRVALVNYATWLHFEREKVCAELYPHMGGKAARFVLTENTATHFFFPDGIGNLVSRAHLAVPPASTRALKVLDLVGVSWREDLTESGRNHLDPPRYRDTGERPAPPHGWPALDAGLVTAASDLIRLAAAINSLPDVDGREPSDLPEYRALVDAIGTSMGVLQHVGAEGLPGLQAKARALHTKWVAADADDFTAVAESLASDLLGASQSWIEPWPDPIFAAIEEAKRLYTAWGAAGELPLSPDDPGPLPETRAAQKAFNRHCGEVLTKTVPRSAAGCSALAAYCREFFEKEGFALDEDQQGRQHLRVLDLIARSPLL